MNKKEKAGSTARQLPSCLQQETDLTSSIIPPRSRPVLVDTPQGRRQIGEISGNIFYKRAQASRHLMVALDAWGIQVEAIEEAQESGVQRVEVEDTETGVVYSVSLTLLLEKGIQRDFGHGLQVFLPRRYWKNSRVKQLQLVVGGGR